MNENTTEPYQAPDAWVALFRRIPDAAQPRVVVSLSAGRSPYRSILDISPTVSRVTREGSPETVTVHPGGNFLAGSVLDVAASIYAAACEYFLDQRRGDGSSFVRTGRLRLQLFDGEAELGSDAQAVAREALGAPVESVVEQASAAHEVIRVLELHSRSLGTQFLTLARQAQEQLAAERDGLVEHCRQALELGREAGDLRAAAVAEMAASNSSPFLATDAGQALVLTAAEQLPSLLGLASSAIAMRREELAVRRAELERQVMDASRSPPAPAPTAKPAAKTTGRKRRARPTQSQPQVNTENGDDS